MGVFLMEVRSGPLWSALVVLAFDCVASCRWWCSASGKLTGLGLPSDSPVAERMTAALTATMQSQGVAIQTGVELVGVENGQWSETGGHVLLKNGGQVSRHRARIVCTWPTGFFSRID